MHTASHPGALCLPLFCCRVINRGYPKIKRGEMLIGLTRAKKKHLSPKTYAVTYLADIIVLVKDFFRFPLFVQECTQKWGDLT